MKTKMTNKNCLLVVGMIVLMLALSFTIAPTQLALADDSIALTSNGGELTSGNYILNENIALTNNIVIAGGETVTLDLNGKTLTGNADGSVITVSEGATLNLYGNEETIGYGYWEGTEYKILSVEDYANLSEPSGYDAIVGGLITGGSGTINSTDVYGGGVYVQSGAEFNMSGGTIAGNTAGTNDTETTNLGSGGGVYSVGTFNMSGGVIAGNQVSSLEDYSEYGASSVGQGGGVNVGQNSEFKMTDGLIVNNKAIDGVYNGSTISAYGGGVFVSWSGVFNMSENAQISENTANSGGGIFVIGTLNISGGTIDYNTATYGGGIYSQMGAIDMTGGTIDANTANYGGGIYTYSIFKMSEDAKITNNIANGSGGGVYVKETFAMDGGTISGNKAAYGGGIYNESGLTITKGIIFDNTASSYGGGIYSKGPLVLSGGTISYNSASIGGGMFNTTGTTEISGAVTISSNSATTYGGGVYIASGKVSMKGGTILNNIAASNGGGLYVEDGEFEMTGGSISSNNALFGGGIMNWGTVVMSSGSVSDNYASTSGGGIYSGDSLTINGGEVSYNTAKYGSGIYSDDKGTVSIWGGTYEGNSSLSSVYDCINGSWNICGPVVMDINSYSELNAWQLANSQGSEFIVRSAIEIPSDSTKDFSLYTLILEAGGAITNNTANSIEVNYDGEEIIVESGEYYFVPTATILETGVSYLTIQEAISDASSGDTVIIADGRISLSETIVIDKNITLQGAGMDETILRASNFTTIKAYEGDTKVRGIYVSNEATDVTLNGFTISGIDEGGNYNSLVVGVGHYDGDYDGDGEVEYLLYEGAFIMEDVKIEDFSKTGVVVYGANTETNQVIIKDCYIDVYGTYQGSRSPNGIEIRRIPDAVISGTTFIDAESTSENWDGVAINAMEGTQLTAFDNNFSACDAYIMVGNFYDYYYSSYYSYIEMNTITCSLVNLETIFTDNNISSEDSYKVTIYDYYTDNKLFVSSGSEYLYKVKVDGEWLLMRAKNMYNDSDESRYIKFTTLETALEQAEAGDVIYITTSITISSNCEIPEGVEIVIVDQEEYTYNGTEYHYFNTDNYNNGDVSVDDAVTVTNNGTIYVYSAEALACAVALGGNIVICEDIVISEQIEINTDVNITALEGVEVTTGSNSGGSIGFLVGGDANVEFHDLTINVGGEVLSNATAIMAENGAIISVDSCVFNTAVEYYDEEILYVYAMSAVRSVDEDDAYSLTFTNNTVNGDFREALLAYVNVGDTFIIKNNVFTADTGDVKYSEDGYSGASAMVVTVIDENAVVNISNNTFEKYIKIISVDNSTETGNWAINSNKFIDVAYAFDLSTANSYNKGYDLGYNYFEFNDVVGEMKVLDSNVQVDEEYDSEKNALEISLYPYYADIEMTTLVYESGEKKSNLQVVSSLDVEKDLESAVLTVVSIDSETLASSSAMIDKVNEVDEAFVIDNSIASKAVVDTLGVELEDGIVSADIAGLAVSALGGTTVEESTTVFIEVVQQDASESESDLILSIKPYIQIGDGAASLIANTDLNTPITVTIELPTNFEGEYVDIEHISDDGIITYYKGIKIVNQTITFTVTHFSIFNIVSNDEYVTSSLPNITIGSQYTVGGSSSSTDVEVETEEEQTETPTTTETPTATIVPVVPEETMQADSNIAWIWILVAVLAIGGIAGFVVYKKKKQ